MADPTPEPSDPSTGPVADTESLDDTELDALEADVAVIESAMDLVDKGDLDAADQLLDRLGDGPADSEQVGDGAVAQEVDPGAEA